jgi:hypothetical protein
MSNILTYNNWTGGAMKCEGDDFESIGESIGALISTTTCRRLAAAL